MWIIYIYIYISSSSSNPFHHSLNTCHLIFLIFGIPLCSVRSGEECSSPSTISSFANLWMNLNTVTLKSPIIPSPPSLSSPIPRLLLNPPISSPNRSRCFSVFGGCNAGVVVFLSKHDHRHVTTCFCSFNGGNGYNGAVVKDIDIATLGNLCVDIVLSVPQLPPAAPEDRKAYMEQLSSRPPDKVLFFLFDIYIHLLRTMISFLT